MEKKKRTAAQKYADRHKRTGRPSKGVDARSISFVVKISPREKADWTRKSLADGMKLGPWIAALRREGR